MHETNTSNPTLIISFGAGLDHKTATDPPLAWIGKEMLLRAAAAAKLWKGNPEARIIFSGWRPAGPGTPSEAEAMAAYIEQFPWNVPREKIFTENEGVDTADNVRRTFEFMRDHGLSSERIFFVGGKKHLRRAMRYFAGYGICAQSFTAKEVLGNGNDIKRLGLPEVSRDITPQDRCREFFLCLLQCIDKKGALATWYKRRQLQRRSKDSMQERKS